MNVQAHHLFEQIQQRGHVDHIVTVNGHSVYLSSNGSAMVDGLSVTSYYCGPCFWYAVDNGGADETTGEGPCVHKAAVAEARRLVEVAA